ncbi:F-box protein At2g39490-like [Rutidosis leptorrhynchoides]|uniref:F-box protein At2g39490-like n=1 Tax=Rutidosis leptorrhynchoides TaxID=125765 RepID=UPI003A99EE81
MENFRPEIEEAYISKLPDEVLTKILSIYPLDSGSKTVASLTGLWYRPCIKHEGTTLNNQDFESALSEFLDNFDENNPLKMPKKLEYHFNNNLIVTASIGLNKKLNIDCSKGRHEFTRHHVGWKIVPKLMEFANASPYQFLVKTLKLTSVNFLTCGDLVTSLIKKFQDVETLIIDRCNDLNYLRIEGLDKLVNISILDCANLNSVCLHTLEIKTLHYRGFLCWFSLYNLMYLEDVKLEFEGPGVFNHIMVHKWMYTSLLSAIQDVKVLTLDAWKYKKAFQPLLNEEQDFRFTKLEDLWWIDNRMDGRDINLLFSFLKLCNSLKRLFITIEPLSYSDMCSNDRHNVIEIEKEPLLRKLKVVKLEGFVNDKEIKYFKERLMYVFGVELVIVDVRQGMHDRCLIRISKGQAFRKAPVSNKMKFMFKFVEVEDNKGLFIKHPHMP